MNKGLFSILAVAIVSLFLLNGASADEGAPAPDTKLLKEISEKQDRILQELADLKSELQIVKIRVSSR